MSPCILVSLADVEGLFGKHGLGGHLVHPAQVDALAELKYASWRLADGLGIGQDFHSASPKKAMYMTKLTTTLLMRDNHTPARGTRNYIHLIRLPRPNLTDSRRDGSPHSLGKYPLHKYVAPFFLRKRKRKQPGAKILSYIVNHVHATTLELPLCISSNKIDDEIWHSQKSPPNRKRSPSLLTMFFHHREVNLNTFGRWVCRRQGGLPVVK